MSEPQLAEIINTAAAAHQNGRFQEALAGYQHALSKAPNDAEANSLAGLALTHLGRLNEAGPYLEKAVAAEPEEIGFRLNLIEWLDASGFADRAVDEIGVVLEKDEKNIRAFEKLGDVCIRQNKPGAASDAYNEAVQLAPGHYGLLMKLARAHSGFRNFEGARAALEQAGHVGPQDEYFLEFLSFVLASLGDVAALNALAAEWTTQSPESPRAWRTAAQAAYEHGRHRDALAAYEKVFELGARDANNLAAYGRIAIDALEFDLARDSLGEAEKLEPNLAEMLAGKARLLTFEGEFDEAETYCRRCLAEKPHLAGVYSLLGRITGGKFTDTEQQKITQLFWEEKLHTPDRIAAGFALGRAQDAAGATDDAFKIFLDANELSRAYSAAGGISYDRAVTEGRMQRLAKLFAGPSGVGAPKRGAKPIFILGMPRSGTTLIESVLSARGDVFAGGERPDIQQFLSWYLDQVGETAVNAGNINSEWIDRYYEQLPDLGDAEWITEKSPLNFEAVGLIDRLFPDSPIVHTRRNPMETCFSIFSNEFSKFWSFATDLDALGHFFGQYAQLMAHWDNAYPGRVITIQYEDFASNFDTAGPALAERIGLGWTPEMAQFQKAKRPIATFSAVQARQPVTVRRGKADQYAKQLAPLRRALEDAGVDPDTGDLR